MTPNLSFVRTFVKLAETGSFIETARLLNLSQPTVSQHIRKLESSLGIQLIIRSNTSCRPTLQGAALLPHANSLLFSAERFEAAAKGRSICIGCSGNIASYYLAPALKQYIETETGPINWKTVVATNPEIADQLEAGEIDVAIMEWFDPRPAFRVYPWKNEPLVVIVPPEHPFSGKENISVEELGTLEFIGGEPGSGTGTLLETALGKQVENIKVTRNLHSTEAVKSAVKAGLGCSIVLKQSVESEASLGQLGLLRIRDIEITKTFYVACLSGLPESALPSRLAGFLTEQFPV